MKIKYKHFSDKRKDINDSEKRIFEYKLVGKISKSQFSELMKISSEYRYSSKTGYILSKSKENFLNLVNQIKN